MEKITLRPFEKLTRRPARSINITELQQLKNSIEKIRDKKLDTPGHAKTLAAELYYLRVIRQIIEQFSGQRKIMKDDLVAAVDRLLRADGWSGRLVQHKIAQGNKFYDFNNSHGPDYALQYYDIAYHSSSLGRGRGAHHYDQEDPALFYYRCETHHDNKTILIGNLQIDAGRLGPDYDAGPAQLSLRHKNLELLMLQSALKHAVTMGKSKVIFPTGAMNEKAQGQPGATGQVLITAQNYEHYHENYKARHRQFNKIFPGERLGCTATGQHELIVLAKTISSAKIWYRKIMGCPNYCGILNLLDNENFSQGTQLIYPPRRKKNYHGLLAGGASEKLFRASSRASHVVHRLWCFAEAAVRRADSLGGGLDASEKFKYRRLTNAERLFKRPNALFEKMFLRRFIFGRTSGNDNRRRRGKILYSRWPGTKNKKLSRHRDTQTAPRKNLLLE